MINWSKVVDPSQRITFPGVELDSTTMQIRLPKAKVDALQAMLLNMQSLKRVSRRQLEKIAGKLSHAYQVIYCGRAFLSSMYTAIAQTSKPTGRIRLAGSVHEDLHWRLHTIQDLNYKFIFFNKHARPTDRQLCYRGSGGIRAQLLLC